MLILWRRYVWIQPARNYPAKFTRTLSSPSTMFHAKSAESKRRSPLLKKVSQIQYLLLYLQATIPFLQLIRSCMMKPSPNHQYWVKNLKLDHVIIKLLKSSKYFLANEVIVNLSKVNSLYREMIGYVAELKMLHFCALREPRFGYVEQTEIQSSRARVNMATACAVNYSLHPGMIIRYIKGEYVGESRNVPQILKNISSHVNETDATHIGKDPDSRLSLKT